MSEFFIVKLSKYTSIQLLSQWCNFKDIVYLDTAICNVAYRIAFLRFCEKNFITCEVNETLKWRNVNLTNYGKFVRKRNIYLLAWRAQPLDFQKDGQMVHKINTSRMISIKFDNCETIAAKTIAAAINCCPIVCRVMLRNVPAATDKILKSTNLKILSQLEQLMFMDCMELTHKTHTLVAKFCTKLKNFTLRNSSTITPADLSAIIVKNQGLEKLECCLVPDKDSGFSHDARSEVFNMLAQLCHSTLQQVYISNCEMGRDLDAVVYLLVTCKCLSVVSLDFCEAAMLFERKGGCTNVTFNQKVESLSGLALLFFFTHTADCRFTSITVINFMQMQDRTLKAIANTCCAESLQSLSLQFRTVYSYVAYRCTAQAIKFIMNKCTKLTFLSLMGLYHLSTEEVRGLFSFPNKLHTLHLKSIGSIKPDLVVEIAERNPHITEYMLPYWVLSTTMNQLKPLAERLPVGVRLIEDTNDYRPL